MGKVTCKKCAQSSVRNIHNKCVYCGHPFDKEYHVTEKERSEKLEEIEATTERLKHEVAREKEREKLRNISSGADIHIFTHL